MYVRDVFYGQYDLNAIWYPLSSLDMGYFIYIIEFLTIFLVVVVDDVL